MSKKKECIYLVIAFVGTMLGLYGVKCFNQLILMSLPIWLRMISMIVIYWLIALIPIIVMNVSRSKLSDYGFNKEKIGLQIIIGILLGIGMSLVLTVTPHLLGFGEYVSNGKIYAYLWQFAYEFFYCIAAVSCVEEFVFRGLIYANIRQISSKDSIAVIGSSVLFGVFHLFSGNIIQMVATACIGVILCVCRLKIKNCSIVSLIIAHGIYDAMITVWTCVSV